MTKERDRALELGTKPIGGLLAQYAIPAIIAMTASSLYNMVDSVFIGQGVGPLAISGLAITFPLMNLAAAFGAGVGVGASTCISVRLGQKDYKTAEHILGNNLVLNLIIGVAVGLVALLFLDPILRFFGASDKTLPYARDYMLIVMGGNVISHTYFGMNAVLRAMGKPRHAMAATIFTVVLNTILDPIFIWPLGMGIQGAAWATVLSQLVALIWQLWLISRKDGVIHLHRGIYGLKGRIVKNILSIGMSPFSMNVCACVVVILINTALVRHGGDLAVGAYGIANRIGFLFFMVVMGINQGMQPIAGYNYGALQMDRVMHVLRLSIIIATLVMTVGWVVSVFFPRYCARLFTSDEELLRLSVDAIRLGSLAFPIIGFQAVTTNFFQSIGKAKISMFLSLSRQLIFLLPLLIVLPNIYGVNGVWYSQPASDLTAAIVTALLLRRQVKRMHVGN